MISLRIKKKSNLQRVQNAYKYDIGKHSED